MIWDLFQQWQIHQNYLDAHEARSAARETRSEAMQYLSRIRELEQTVERMSLVSMATAEILRDRLGISEQEIEAKIQEIDLRDGQLDGKLNAPRTSLACPQCQRPNGPRRRACLYCGEPLSPYTPPSDSITDA